MTNESRRQQHDERPDATFTHPLADIAAQVDGELVTDGPAVTGIEIGRAHV